jgi:hypothetical protein
MTLPRKPSIKWTTRYGNAYGNGQSEDIQEKGTDGLKVNTLAGREPGTGSFAAITEKQN